MGGLVTVSNGIADVIGGYYWGKVTPKIMPHKLLWVTPAWNGKGKKNVENQPEVVLGSHDAY